jgi:histone-lysine N-methyltransferase SETMAR
VEWHNSHSPSKKKKKTKTVPSAAKVMDTVFWDAERCTLAEFLTPGQTINAARYVQTLHKRRRAWRDKRPGRTTIMLHDNANPHAASLTLEAIAKMGWEVLPHPSYSPDLELFLTCKGSAKWTTSETGEAIQRAVRQCRRITGTEFYRRERWEKCVQRSGDYAEK